MISEELRERLTQQMARLNKTAAQEMKKFKVHACTDVTGFGLLGHLKEMTVGSACDATIFYDKVPFLPDVKNLAVGGVIPGGSYNNLNFISGFVNFGNLPRTDQLLLCDAQTSGGLLIALPEDEAEKLLADLILAGIQDACIIGEFIATGKGMISIR